MPPELQAPELTFGAAFCSLVVASGEAGPPLVRPVGRGVPASLARLAAIEGGSVEKSGCVDG